MTACIKLVNTMGDKSQTMGNPTCYYNMPPISNVNKCAIDLGSLKWWYELLNSRLIPTYNPTGANCSRDKASNLMGTFESHVLTT